MQKQGLTFFSIFSGILLCLPSLKAQVTDHYNGPVNYVRTWTAQAPETNPNNLMTRPLRDVKQSTVYFDGLGRPIETVARQGSLTTGGTGVDLVVPVQYDAYGREAFKLLPFAANNTENNLSISDGDFKSNPYQEQTAFYTDPNGVLKGQGESFFYGKIDFEASPLNRATKTYASGSAWVGSGRGVEQKYWINTANDGVRIWTATDTYASGIWGSYSSPGVYAPGDLFKSVTVDEKANQVIEFKDEQGHVVLKKVQLTATADDGSGRDHTGWLCTYYIYDEYGLLRCVIQPGGVETLAANNWALMNYSGGVLLNEQCFRYEYDQRNRMILKKVPGAGEVWMVYDARDRLVLSQDANLRGQNNWLFTKYDQLNRPIITGMYADAAHTSQSSMQSYLDAQNAGLYETYNSGSYPLYTLSNSFPAVSSGSVITYTYYDDYSWAGWYGNYASKDNSLDGNFPAADNSSFPYPQPQNQSNQTGGMVTGTWDKNGGMVSAFFYDDKGRMIQTKHYNYTGGIDITTNQYGFSGQVLQSVIQHQKAGTNAQTHVVQTRNSYDDLSRLTKIEKKINSTIGSTSIAVDWKTISNFQYDALGQLLAKQVGNDPVNQGIPLETLKYEYNIRGWLLGMNRDYATARNTFPLYNNKFGFDLSYDQVRFGVYEHPAFNGNIAGMIWKTIGDNVSRKYEFSYDAVNRLTGADFTQFNGDFFGKDYIDYSVTGLSYDVNGNILSMQQNGWKLGGSIPIDKLTYSYFTNSNKLQAVSEDPSIGTTDNHLGDFTDKNTSNTDYGYDLNGNLITDLNKRINGATGLDQTSGGAVSYNYLNLPVLINVQDDNGNAKGSITYTYDASGNKLQKQVVELPSTANQNVQTTTTTAYIDGFVYESKTHAPSQSDDYTEVLQFIAHEEGRVRYRADNNTLPFDYFLKDHLGNVRMVLTEDTKTEAYPAATMETANAATENVIYYNLDATRTATPTEIGYPTDNSYSNPNNYVAKVNGSGQKIGPAIALKVMAGDRVNIKVNSWYASPFTSYAAPNALNELVNAIAGSIAPLTSGKATTMQLSNSSNFSSNVMYYAYNESYDNTKPKAYLRCEFFDEQFNWITGSSDQVKAANASAVYVHQFNNLIVPKNGYVYIFVDNETPNQDVYFDNFQVTLNHGPLVEENHYYPFGLTMQGISSKALNFGGSANKFKFGGKELNSNEFGDNSGLELYDFHARNYDPQIGRWWSNDPKADKSVWISPYNYCLNNPIKFFDPDGKFPYPVTIRAFAPAGTLKGTGFANDNRGFSANTNATSRIAQTFIIDPTKQSITGGTPSSSTTYWNGIPAGNGTKSTDEGGVDKKLFSKNSFGSNVATAEAHFAGSNPAFFGTAPNIDVKSMVTLSENVNGGYVIASVDLSSKQFPATEAIVGDNKGQSVWLTGAAAYGSPSNLMNADVKEISSVDVRININEKGEFTGVEYGGKTYSIADWNKAQTAKPAGPFPMEDKDKQPVRQ